MWRWCWLVPALAQELEVRLQIPQVAIDAQRLSRLAGEGEEVLVARKRPRLLVETAHQPVKELAHGLKLAPGECRNSLDF